MQGKVSKEEEGGGDCGFGGGGGGLWFRAGMTWFLQGEDLDILF